MPENAPVVLVPASFPDGYCPQTWQALANDLASKMAGYVPGSYNFFNYGTTEPSVNNRNKPWFRLNPDGTPDKWYVFALGVWVSPHAVEASGDERRIWAGIESDVWLFDGGDGTNPSVSAPTDATGAMWEVDHNFDFRFPLGAGTSPAPTSTTVNSGDDGGEEKVTLGLTNMPAHNHDLWVGSSDGSTSGYREAFQTVNSPHSGTDAAYRQNGSGADDPLYMKKVHGDTDGNAVAHNNMPPYRGVFFIKRTARRFYTP